MIISSLVGLSSGIVVSFLLHKRFRSRFLSELDTYTLALREYARGDMQHPVPLVDGSHLFPLGYSINQVRSSVTTRLAELEKKYDERDALLSSMADGIVALDTKQRVKSINDEAKRILSVAPDRDVDGVHILEVLRSKEILEVLEELAEFSATQTVETELVINQEQGKTYRVYAKALTDKRGRMQGALIGFSDVTTIRHLEQVRKDFVANVSHELKTPITSIKGFVETLLDGAYQDPEECERFLKIASKHADRLSAIIEDLLALSHIEQGAERAGVERVEQELAPVLEAAILICSVKAKAKKVAVSFSGDRKLATLVNDRLLEQAVVNLVDNAIKYSGEGSAVKVSLSQVGNEAQILVSDQGLGIPKQYLSRLFERFYRVDKARSREMGGTGLGLALVKHIAYAHGGRVEVSSEIGVGSEFGLYLPVG